MIYNDIDIIYWFFVQKGRNERSRAMKKILTLFLAAMMAVSAPASVVLAAPDTEVETVSVSLKAAKSTAI